ncbi:MAG: hypothetical protein FWH31_01205 [Streptococcaceae bacterium]|nr:hypothetical protein [Streptococcaceae bacterium]
MAIKRTAEQRSCVDRSQNGVRITYHRSEPFRLAALADCDLNLPLYRIAVGAKAATDRIVVSASGVPLRLGALLLL